MKNTMLRSKREKWSASPASAVWFVSNCPLSLNCSRNVGTTTETMEGMRSSVMTPPVVMLPLIQSMMVVTSPMGENAPPALAERMMQEA